MPPPAARAYTNRPGVGAHRGGEPLDLFAIEGDDGHAVAAKLLQVPVVGRFHRVEALGRELLFPVAELTGGIDPYRDAPLESLLDLLGELLGPHVHVGVGRREVGQPKLRRGERGRSGKGNGDGEPDNRAEVPRRLIALNSDIVSLLSSC